MHVEVASHKGARLRAQGSTTYPIICLSPETIAKRFQVVECLNISGISGGRYWALAADMLFSGHYRNLCNNTKLYNQQKDRNFTAMLYINYSNHFLTTKMNTVHPFKH